MSNKIERYIRTTQSSNLKDSDATEHHIDPLLSVAWCKIDMGSALYRVKYGNDSTSYQSLLNQFTALTIHKAIQKQWPQHVSPKKIAKKALDYWINPLCYVCKGRGEDVKINERGGIDRNCDACDNTGNRPINDDSRIRDYIRDMVAVLDEAEITILRTMRQ